MAYLLYEWGNELYLDYDGWKARMIPMTANQWVAVEDPQLRAEKVGNQYLIHTQGITLNADPTNANVWIVSGGGDVPNPPNPGDGGIFSWPYRFNFQDTVFSYYGPRSGRFHQGVDFSGGRAANNQPIPCVGDGYVHFVGNNPNAGFGYNVTVFHGEYGGRDVYTVYAHMIAPPPVSVGDVAPKGSTLGRVGNTGNSFGAHLHLETHMTAVGGPMISDNLNPSYNSNRTTVDPFWFFENYGDGNILNG